MADEQDDARRLKELHDRIEAAKAKRAPPQRSEEAHSQAEVAWRMVIELVAGIVIGGAIGYGLDALLGTRPWLLIVFVLLGFAAGINVMMRTAREVAGAQPPKGSGPRARTEDADGE